MAEITILEETLLEDFDDQGSGYLVIFMDTDILLSEGETYRIVWDDVDYVCVSFGADGAVCVGNTEFLGGADTQQPFFVGVIPGALHEQETNSLMCAAKEGPPHRLAIYQTAEAEAVPSATVKIKGYSGAEFEYQNVPKVWLAAPESTADNPVLVPFTYGEAVDDVQIVPDFSSGDHTLKMPAGEMARSAVVKKPDGLIPGNIKAGETVAGITGEYEGEVPETEELTVPADFTAGDMVLVPAEGKILSKATVQKPETLIPENIAEGVDIAGIIGNFIGGSDVKWASGTIEQASTASVTVEHVLGVIPDIFIVSNTTGIANGIIYNMCVSSAFADKYGIQISRCGLYAQSSAVNARYLYYNGNYMAALEGYMQLGVAGQGTAETVSIPGSTSIPIAAGTVWTAIAGLT